MGREDLPTSRRDGRLAQAGMNAAMKDREGKSFVALPHVVLDSPGWREVSPIARALLLDLAEPMYRLSGAPWPGRPNGGLMIERDRLRARGWASVDVITRCVKELVRCGLIVETRKGALGRPALFAVTWHGLATGRTYHLDIDATAWGKVHRGAYAKEPQSTDDAAEQKARRVAAAAKATAARKAAAAARKNATPGPCDGREAASKRPSHGQSNANKGPSHGRLGGSTPPAAGPSDGHSLEHCHLHAPVVARPLVPRLLSLVLARRVRHASNPAHVAAVRALGQRQSSASKETA